MKRIEVVMLAATLAASLTVSMGAGAAHAQTPPGDVPVVITSDASETRERAGTSIFTGNVVATQDGSRITTDKLTLSCARAAPGGAAGRCEPESLVAEGNVIYTGDGVKIRGDHALYDYGADTVTVTGDVIMARGADGVIRGTKVVYTVSDGVTRISGGSDRVTGYFGGSKN